MKFSQYTPAVSPNKIGNGGLRAPNLPVEHVEVRQNTAAGVGAAAASKASAAMADAFGQIGKFLQKQQDDKDGADVMEARNKIMQSLTSQMYGENGILTTGIGENAKGLEARVTEAVKKTFSEISGKYNRRVQSALRGSLSENMGNYQRIAAQQEGREFVKQKELNYNSALALNADGIAAAYDNPETIDGLLKDSLNLIHYRAVDQGWSGQQLELEKRAKLTALVGGAIDNAIGDGNLDQAENLLGRFRGGLSQEAVMKWEKTIRQENGIQISREMGEYLYQHFKDDPEGARKYIYDTLAQEMETVGGGGSYSGNAEIDSLISAAEKKYNLPAGLLPAVAAIESGFDNDAESGAGALGIMQLMPDTAAGLGVDPHDKAQNIDGGARYLRQMLDAFGGDVNMALAAYNAGPNAVKEYGGIPPYAETQDYVKKALRAMDGYKQKGGGGVSYDKLDDDIDAEGVDITGTKPETIGMINRANQIHKEMFGSSLWVSCTTGGHAAGTAHALGDKGDVGSDALAESRQNREAFEARLKAEGIGAVNEYDHPSEGSTGGHFDLNVTGYDWYNGTNHGGFKGGSWGGHTRRKYTEKQLDDIWRQYNARVNDGKALEKAASSARVDGYINALKNMSQTEASSYLERLRNDADYQDYSKVLTAAHAYFPDMFKKGGSGGSGSGSKSSRTYYNGVSGARYTANQIEDAKAAFEEYEERRNDKDETISRTDQRRYNKAARILNDVQGNSGDNLASKEGLQLARHAVKVTSSDEEAEWYLIEHGKFTESEARAYVEMVHGSEEED